MGNFSRDTFDPSKRYLAVRLQQGVPLVDADWNEQNDVIRQENYDAWLSTMYFNINSARVFLSSSPSSSFSLNTNGSTGRTNNFYVYGGRGFARGRYLNFSNGWRTYNDQALRDVNLATEWGVDPLPDLTTPTSARTDCVYLDIWDREINSTEDPDIINPVISVETAVRLKREIVVRVNEGSSWSPIEPDGHIYIPIARLSREAGNNLITESMVEDLRYISSTELSGNHYQQICPKFFPFSTLTNWTNNVDSAYKGSSISCYGLIPLSFPDMSRFNNIYLRGQMGNIGTGSTRLFVGIYRMTPTATASNLVLIASDSYTNLASINRAITIPPEERRVTSVNSNFVLYISASGPGYIYLRSIRLNYTV